MTSRTDVYLVIDGERDYQDSHTLHEPKDPGFTTGDYITMMTAYVDKLAAAWAFNPGVAPEDVLHNMRKIAAIAVQCMEVHGAPSRSVEGLGQWGRVSRAMVDENVRNSLHGGKRPQQDHPGIHGFNRSDG